ncbi:hypothetical protein ACVJBD_003473 [Rhizobium mongolense]
MKLQASRDAAIRPFFYGPPIEHFGSRTATTC